MILYVLRKNTNMKSVAYGKYYAFPVIEETIELDGLAEHMANHNTPYSKGAIKGVLTDMVNCIKELLLEGKNVKIADLAIFSLGIKNKKGCNRRRTSRWRSTSRASSSVPAPRVNSSPGA